MSHISNSSDTSHGKSVWQQCDNSLGMYENIQTLPPSPNPPRTTTNKRKKYKWSCLHLSSCQPQVPTFTHVTQNRGEGNKFKYSVPFIFRGGWAGQAIWYCATVDWCNRRREGGYSTEQPCVGGVRLGWRRKTERKSCFPSRQTHTISISFLAWHNYQGSNRRE